MEKRFPKTSPSYYQDGTTGNNVRHLTYQELLRGRTLESKRTIRSDPTNETLRIQMRKELIDAKPGDLFIILAKKEIDGVTEFIYCE